MEKTGENLKNKIHRLNHKNLFRENNSSNVLKDKKYNNELTKNINIPWFAIGGITKTNISTLKSHGINKVAIVSALLNSEDPKEEAIIILKKLLSHEN